MLKSHITQPHRWPSTMAQRQLCAAIIRRIIQSAKLGVSISCISLNLVAGGDEPVAESDEARDGIILDYGRDGKLFHAIRTD